METEISSTAQDPNLYLSSVSPGNARESQAKLGGQRAPLISFHGHDHKEDEWGRAQYAPDWGRKHLHGLHILGMGGHGERNLSQER